MNISELFGKKAKAGNGINIIHIVGNYNQDDSIHEKFHGCTICDNGRPMVQKHLYLYPYNPHIGTLAYKAGYTVIKIKKSNSDSICLLGFYFDDRKSDDCEDIAREVRWLKEYVEEIFDEFFCKVGLTAEIKR